MHENELTREIIGAAIEVHRLLGPGLLEVVYEEALCHELHLRGIAFKRQQSVSLDYKGVHLKTDLRLDLLIDNRIIIDLKVKETLSSTDKPQLLTYLRLCNLKVGLIINFHVPVLKEGVFRVMNGFISPEDPPDFRSPSVYH